MILLFVIAIIILIIALPIGVLVCVFNAILIKDSDHLLGDEDGNVRSVMGKNILARTLTNTGELLDLILEVINKNYTVKSVE